MPVNIPIELLDFIEQDGLQGTALLLAAAGRAADSLVYLAELDEKRFGGVWLEDGHDDIAQSDAHLRWASTTAITSLDLLAATLGRRYKLIAPNSKGNTREISARDIHPEEKLFGRLPTSWQDWIRRLYDDRRYKLVLLARNPVTHGDAPRIRQASTKRPAGHAARELYRFGSLDIPAGSRAQSLAYEPRPIIEAARDIAIDYANAFVDVLMAMKNGA